MTNYTALRETLERLEKDKEQADTFAKTVNSTNAVSRFANANISQLLEALRVAEAHYDDRS